MNLINQLVSNARYGTGTITSIESDIMTVQFSEKSCKYKYPDAFQKYLVLEDESLQAEMNAIATKAVEEKELADKKEKERKIKEAIASIEEAKQSGKQDAPKKKTAPQKKNPSSNQTNTIKWDPGKRRTYYVFQGGSFDDEYAGGYIWAPYESKAGRPFHYWERLKDLKPGDMIFHAAHGKIKAISIVREPYSIVPRLERTAGLPNEEEPGYLVRCDYTYINDPISAWDYTEVIKQYSHVKYSPFNSNGTGNLGYLYELDQRLAAFFLEESIKKNPSIGEIDFVREFLA